VSGKSSVSLYQVYQVSLINEVKRRWIFEGWILIGGSNDVVDGWKKLLIPADQLGIV